MIKEGTSSIFRKENCLLPIGADLLLLNLADEE